MAQTIVLTLLQCSVWSALLWWLLQQLQRKIPALTHWPMLYWLILVLGFLPLLPTPEFATAWPLPSVLLQDAVLSVQTLTAQPQHPGVTPALLSWQLIWPLTLTILLLVSLWQLLKVAQQWHCLQRLIRLAQPLPLSALLHKNQRAVLPAGFTIRQTPLTVSPFIAGGRRMVLVVPAYIWQLSPEQRGLLVSHELVHLKRRDPQQLLLLRVVVACCWFMPSLRYLERAFSHSAELAVDRAVLQQQPGQAVLYGQTLLQSLKLSQSARTPTMAAGFIQANTDKALYQQRFAALFQQVPTLSAPAKFGLGLLFTGVMLLSQFSWAALSGPVAVTQWQLPVANAGVSSFFAERHPFRQQRPHQGVDFAAAKGVQVVAGGHGRVLIADDSSLNSRYGKVVLIEHGAGYQTLYAHLNAFHVQPGQLVRAGEPIGTVGATGKVTGPHLHFEILLNGEQQNPALYLPLK
ncbi:MAG: peptidoglycan DD-metalloendopeptidase family protein [Gammaproteobacteria bacterium]|nr:peptidoglycan DD-metalloendopeptidase family protein [Gammaproteobacteria bacterium]MBU1554111.1 peptidoglycan DD-metalloendopeptidase family protein [Gammaproteobacteria bacterium]MBU2072211.1 peptidoglycan DD-metalloendopeptidase family protein [Gammaproteobacteria bacterium]MBU2182073.1 peptidoglycan DD-metalloendopeptidase family protein [Gammaproteobacteria bacterium]MBU2203916.1 peptidoglycan DD-metalloendopeptidase family protein [Gammaproteobacteria bacterium]